MASQCSHTSKIEPTIFCEFSRRGCTDCFFFQRGLRSFTVLFVILSIGCFAAREPSGLRFKFHISQIFRQRLTIQRGISLPSDSIFNFHIQLHNIFRDLIDCSGKQQITIGITYHTYTILDPDLSRIVASLYLPTSRRSGGVTVSLDLMTALHTKKTWDEKKENLGPKNPHFQACPGRVDRSRIRI